MAGMADEELHSRRAAEQRALKLALALIVGFMAVEIVAGILASSLALLSDAAHMLTDAAALALSLVAARLASRPAGGPLTYGLGRVEILMRHPGHRTTRKGRRPISSPTGPEASGRRARSCLPCG